MLSNGTCVFRLSIREVRLTPTRRVSHTILGVSIFENLLHVSLPPQVVKVLDYTTAPDDGVRNVGDRPLLLVMTHPPSGHHWSQGCAVATPLEGRRARVHMDDKRMSGAHEYHSVLPQADVRPGPCFLDEVSLAHQQSKHRPELDMSSRCINHRPPAEIARIVQYALAKALYASIHLQFQITYCSIPHNRGVVSRCSYRAGHFCAQPPPPKLPCKNPIWSLWLSRQGPETFSPINVVFCWSTNIGFVAPEYFGESLIHPGSSGLQLTTSEIAD